MLRSALLLASLLLAALAAPPAAAQLGLLNHVVPLWQTTVELAIRPPEGPLPVDGDPVALPVEVRYTYTTVPGSFRPTAVELRVTDLPPWLVAMVSPSMVYVPMQPGEAVMTMVAQHTAHALLLLKPTTDAPAFQQGVVELSAYAHPNDPYMPSETRNQIPVEADFYALTDVRAPVHHLGLRAGEEASLPLTVTNHGNGPVRVRFALDHAPPGLEVTLPPSAVLGARQTGDGRVSATVPLRIGADGPYEAGDVVVRVLTAHARDPALVGDSVAVEVHVSGEGSRDGVQVHSLGVSPAGPAWLETGLAFAGLAGVLLYARTRRRA